MGRFFGMFCAITLHGVVLLFGGILFLDDEEDLGTLQEVELLTTEETEEQEDEQEEEPVAEETEELQTEAEEVPDAAEILRSLELSALQPEPELEAASLGAIADALNGLAGGGDFDDALSFASGGRIGGTGKVGALDEELEGAFSMTEIDQKPRAVFQSAPLFPAEMRGKKVEGVVTLIFIVDAAGKVSNPKVEKSTHTAFEKPALSAIRQWKFEPAVKSGQRVPCPMRIDIRFQPT